MLFYCLDSIANAINFGFSRFGPNSRFLVKIEGSGQEDIGGKL
jgi:hypothetical protein